MAIPKIPPILTEADWNKNKGKFAKMAGKTGIGPLMAAVQLFYDEVKWSAFDVQQALRATDTADQIDEQLKLAEAEYQKVTPLVKKLNELEVQAALTQQKFSKSPVIPKASAAYVGKVAAGAKLFSGQVQLVKAEYDAFKLAAARKRAAAVNKNNSMTSIAKALAKSRPTLTINKVTQELFARLNDLDWTEEPEVREWSKSLDVILPPLGNAPSNTLKTDQTRLAKAINDFELHKQNLKTLQSHLINNSEIETLKQEVATLQTTLKTALTTMTDYENDIKQVISKSDTETLGKWDRDHHNVIELTQHVKTILNNEKDNLSEFNEAYEDVLKKILKSKISKPEV